MTEGPTPLRCHYGATVLGVHDGGTVTLEIDLGLWIKRVEKLRLRGIGAPGKMIRLGYAQPRDGQPRDGQPRDGQGARP